MAEQKVSIKRIAELTGYSVATVSRVINQNGRFSKETEEKIQQVIDELGYVPDAAAKSLRMNTSRIVAVIMPSLVNELFAKIYAAIQSNLLAHGYVSVIYDANETSRIQAKPRNLLPMLRSLNICGVIVISVREEYASLEALGIPVVYIDCERSVSSGNSVCIEYDMAQGGRAVAEKLIACGCQQIAAMTNSRTRADGQYLNEISKTLATAGLALNCDPRLIPADESFAAAVQAVGAAWDSGLRFDGLILPKDSEAVAAAQALLSRGISIPGQVRLVGCDDISVAVNTMLPLTTLRVETETIGALAVDCLLSLRNGDGPSQKEYLIPLTLIERQTT